MDTKGEGIEAEEATIPSYAIDSSSIIKFTPISGVREDYSPICYLLEMDQCKILLDCGCFYDFNMDHLEPLRKIAKSIDMIVISHADMKHLGALPFLFGTLGCSCPILVTVPVHHFGLIVLKDAVESFKSTFGKDISNDYSNASLEKLFDHFTMLRYSQPFVVTTGPAKGISFVAFPSGHSVGGSIWKFKRNNEDIVYAIDFNHKREAHLDGAPFEAIANATVLIGDAKNALDAPFPRKNRDASFMDSILATFKQGGNVLVPVDTVGRCLEIVQVLSQQWKEQKISHPIVFLSYQSRRVIDIAKGLLEWMGVSMMKSFEQYKSNPFDLNCIVTCSSLKELESISNPKVILSTCESLDCGLSRQVLVSLASSSKNTIIFPGFDVPTFSLINKIISLKSEKEKIKLEFKEQVPLEGDELAVYNKQLQEEKERIAAETAYALHKKKLDEEALEDYDEEMENDVGGKLLLLQNDIAIDSANKLRQVFWTDYRQDYIFDYTLNLPCLDNLVYPLILDENNLPIRHQVFPYREKRIRKDTYGSYFDHSILERPDSNNTVLLSEEKNPKANEEATPAIILPPMKWKSSFKEFSIKCAKKVIDFRGLVDGASLKTIYKRILPRYLILIDGPEDATEFLANHFKFIATQQQEANKISLDVFAPKMSQTIVVSSSINVVSAMLNDQLQSSIITNNFMDYEVTRLEVKKETNEEGSLILGLSDLAISRKIPMILGDLKLKDFRRTIQNANMSGEFLSGDLICSEGNVRMRKQAESGLITLEGTSCPDYYKIRQMLYDNMGVI